MLLAIRVVCNDKKSRFLKKKDLRAVESIRNKNFFE